MLYFSKYFIKNIYSMITDQVHNISCVIIVKNAESTIKRVLDSLTDFEDIVLYSNNTTDKTIEISKNYSNVNLIYGEFLGFGETKNKAVSFAKNEWILSLDADEVLSEEFISNLKKLDLNIKTVYTILRINYYKDYLIKHCWGNDILVRIYNKSITSFSNKHIHESIITKEMNIVAINGEINHYPYASISDFIRKLDYYSSIYVNDNIGKKTSPLKALLNAEFSFIKTYIIKKGFLDGYPGLIIAFSHMATTFYKHMKLYEKNKELSL